MRTCTQHVAWPFVGVKWSLPPPLPPIKQRKLWSQIVCTGFQRGFQDESPEAANAREATWKGKRWSRLYTTDCIKSGVNFKSSPSVLCLDISFVRDGHWMVVALLASFHSFLPSKEAIFFRLYDSICWGYYYCFYGGWLILSSDSMRLPW